MNRWFCFCAVREGNGMVWYGNMEFSFLFFFFRILLCKYFGEMGGKENERRNWGPKKKAKYRITLCPYSEYLSDNMCRLPKASRECVTAASTLSLCSNPLTDTSIKFAAKVGRGRGGLMHWEGNRLHIDDDGGLRWCTYYSMWKMTKKHMGQERASGFSQ